MHINIATCNIEVHSTYFVRQVVLQTRAHTIYLLSQPDTVYSHEYHAYVHIVHEYV